MSYIALYTRLNTPAELISSLLNLLLLAVTLLFPLDVILSYVLFVCGGGGVYDMPAAQKKGQQGLVVQPAEHPACHSILCTESS